MDGCDVIVRPNDLSDSLRQALVWESQQQHILRTICSQKLQNNGANKTNDLQHAIAQVERKAISNLNFKIIYMSDKICQIAHYLLLVHDEENIEPNSINAIKADIKGLERDVKDLFAMVTEKVLWYRSHYGEALKNTQNAVDGQTNVSLDDYLKNKEIKCFDDVSACVIRTACSACQTFQIFINCLNN